ncbi:hypothetical protein [Ideonella sp. YS5]|uniref:hypothetical protein n=1 Tax=Ideonella sp. YS5 TaxID=3453714 RepID=UPI003EEF0D57
MQRWVGRMAAYAALAALAACGGGGGGGGNGDDGSGTNPPPAAGKPEGAYAGTLTGTVKPWNSFKMVVLENDESWTIYGNTVDDTFYVGGFIHATGVSGAGSFASSGWDYSNDAPTQPSMSLSYVAGASIQGSVVYPGGSMWLQGTTAATAPYDYEQAASLSSLVGNWNLTALDGSPVVATVAADGTFTSNSDGCISTGTFVSRPSGKNVFNVTLAAGPAPCEAPGATSSGIAIYSPIEGSASHQLIVGTVDSNAAYIGTLAVGTR